MILDETKPIKVEDGEIILAAKWFVRHVNDDAGNVYYTSKDGRCWGTQESSVQNVEDL